MALCVFLYVCKKAREREKMYVSKCECNGLQQGAEIHRSFWDAYGRRTERVGGESGEEESEKF